MEEYKISFVLTVEHIAQLAGNGGSLGGHNLIK